MSRKHIKELRKMQKFMLLNESIRKEYEQRYCQSPQGVHQPASATRPSPKVYY